MTHHQTLTLAERAQARKIAKVYENQVAQDQASVEQNRVLRDLAGGLAIATAPILLPAAPAMMIGVAGAAALSGVAYLDIGNRREGDQAREYQHRILQDRIAVHADRIVQRQEQPLNRGLTPVELSEVYAGVLRETPEEGRAQVQLYFNNALQEATTKNGQEIQLNRDAIQSNRQRIGELERSIPELKNQFNDLNQQSLENRNHIGALYLQNDVIRQEQRQIDANMRDLADYHEQRLGLVETHLEEERFTRFENDRLLQNQINILSEMQAEQRAEAAAKRRHESNQYQRQLAYDTAQKSAHLLTTLGAMTNKPELSKMGAVLSAGIELSKSAEIIASGGALAMASGGLGVALVAFQLYNAFQNQNQPDPVQLQLNMVIDQLNGMRQEMYQGFSFLSEQLANIQQTITHSTQFLVSHLYRIDDRLRQMDRRLHYIEHAMSTVYAELTQLHDDVLTAPFREYADRILDHHYHDDCNNFFRDLSRKKLDTAMYRCGRHVLGLAQKINGSQLFDEEDESVKIAAIKRMCNGTDSIQTRVGYFERKYHELTTNQAPMSMLSQPYLWLQAARSYLALRERVMRHGRIHFVDISLQTIEMFEQTGQALRHFYRSVRTSRPLFEKLFFAYEEAHKSCIQVVLETLKQANKSVYQVQEDHFELFKPVAEIAERVNRACRTIDLQSKITQEKQKLEQVAKSAYYRGEEPEHPKSLSRIQHPESQGIIDSVWERLSETISPLFLVIERLSTTSDYKAFELSGNTFSFEQNPTISIDVRRGAQRGIMGPRTRHEYRTLTSLQFKVAISVDNTQKQLMNIVQPIERYVKTQLQSSLDGHYESHKNRVEAIINDRLEMLRTNFANHLDISKHVTDMDNKFTMLRGFLSLAGYDFEATRDLFPLDLDRLRQKIKNHFTEHHITSDADAGNLSTAILGQTYQDFKHQIMRLDETNYDRTLDTQLENSLDMFHELREMIIEYDQSALLQQYCRTGDASAIGNLLNHHPSLVNYVSLGTFPLRVAVESHQTHIVLELIRHHVLRDGDLYAEMQQYPMTERNYMHYLLDSMDYIYDQLQAIEVGSFEWCHYQLAAAINDHSVVRINEIFANISDQQLVCRLVEENDPLWEVILRYATVETLSLILDRLSDSEQFFYHHPNILYRMALREQKQTNTDWSLTRLLLSAGADNLLPASHRAHAYSFTSILQQFSAAALLRRDYLIQYPTQLLIAYPPKNANHHVQIVNHLYNHSNFIVLEPTVASLIRAIRFVDMLRIQTLLPQVLLEQRIDSRGDSILHIAIAAITADVTRSHIFDYIVEFSQDLVDTVGEFGWTTLHTAAWVGHPGVIGVLLNTKVSSIEDFSTSIQFAQQIDSDGQTAIRLSVMHGHAEAVKVLIEYGALENIIDTDIATLKQASSNEIIRGFIDNRVVLRCQHLLFTAVQYQNLTVFDRAHQRLGNNFIFSGLRNYHGQSLLAVAVVYPDERFMDGFLHRLRQLGQLADVLTAHGAQALTNIPASATDMQRRIVILVASAMNEVGLLSTVPEPAASIYMGYQAGASMQSNEQLTDQMINTTHSMFSVNSAMQNLLGAVNQLNTSQTSTDYHANPLLGPATYNLDSDFSDDDEEPAQRSQYTP